MDGALDLSAKPRTIKYEDSDPPASPNHYLSESDTEVDNDGSSSSDYGNQPREGTSPVINYRNQPRGASPVNASKPSGQSAVNNLKSGISALNGGHRQSSLSPRSSSVSPVNEVESLMMNNKLNRKMIAHPAFSRTSPVFPYPQGVGSSPLAAPSMINPGIPVSSSSAAAFPPPFNMYSMNPAAMAAMFPMAAANNPAAAMSAGLFPFAGATPGLTPPTAQFGLNPMNGISSSPVSQYLQQNKRRKVESPSSNTSSTPKQQQQTILSVPTTPNCSEEIETETYSERRRKNNEAAKRSRESRRQKEEGVAIRAALLEQENLKLKAQVAVLKNETMQLHCMLYQM